MIEKNNAEGDSLMFGKKKLFHESMEPRCAYCSKGAPLEEGRILCAKKGIVRGDSHCGRFQYDPLKRVPPKPAVLNTSKLKAEDFRLD